VNGFCFAAGNSFATVRLLTSFCEILKVGIMLWMQRSLHGSSNAALEWQARSSGRRREPLAACPLEGLVRRVVSQQARSAGFHLTSSSLALKQGLRLRRLPIGESPFHGRCMFNDCLCILALKHFRHRSITCRLLGYASIS
jgi:hypothetical protein